MLRFFERHPGTRWRLILFGLTIPLAIAGAVFIWQDHQARRDAIITQVSLKSAQVCAQLDDFVHTVRAASEVFTDTWVRSHPPASTDPAESRVQRSYLADFVAERPQLSHAFITDTTGVIRSSSASFVAGQRIGSEAFYQKALSMGQFTVSDAVVPSGDGSPFALFVQPLTWNGGTPEGFLVLQSELQTISGALDMSVGFPKTAKSGIFDSQGRILAGAGYEAPHPGLAVGRDVSGSAVWAQAMTHPTKEWFGPGLDKVDRIIFFAYPDSTPWVTTVAYAQSL